MDINHNKQIFTLGVLVEGGAHQREIALLLSSWYLLHGMFPTLALLSGWIQKYIIQLTSSKHLLWRFGQQYFSSYYGLCQRRHEDLQYCVGLGRIMSSNNRIVKPERLFIGPVRLFFILASTKRAELDNGVFPQPLNLTLRETNSARIPQSIQHLS